MGRAANFRPPIMGIGGQYVLEMVGQGFVIENHAAAQLNQDIATGVIVEVVKKFTRQHPISGGEFSLKDGFQILADVRQRLVGFLLVV